MSWQTLSGSSTPECITVAQLKISHVSDMVLSGHFCHHILLRECHVKNTDYNVSSLWYHVGNGLIRFYPVELFLVSELAFGEYSESNLELFKRKNSRLRRIYFQSSKVKVKMIVDWFRNLGPNNKISDDEDVAKLASFKKLPTCV
ncbi:hypothetical protein Ddye_014362 [Dipteronia dyeriana]|uniref:Uncharacterized protein n=1 Tax=Dipteronia dyeriana TaxID=168575 RepID=A0AAE0CKJ1_9ROSI|nr:hypothetical protein Ddye_014362 [Dipteronia dyeriana]